MAILYVADRATSDSFVFAVGSDALVVDSLPTLHAHGRRAPGRAAGRRRSRRRPGRALQFTEANRVAPAAPRASCWPGVGSTWRCSAQALRAGVREVVNPDDLRAVSDACRRSLEVSRGMLGASARRAGVRGQGHHRLLRQGRLRQDDARDQPRGRAGRRRRAHRVPGRPRPGLRRRRDQPAAAAAADDRRRGGDGAARSTRPAPQSLLTRAQPRALDACSPRSNPGDAEQIPATRGGRAGAHAEADVRLRRRRHPAGVHRARAHGVRRHRRPACCWPRWTSRP